MSKNDDFDWDDAYANMAHIENGAEYPARWAAEADAFRNRWPVKRLNEVYGDSSRQALDVFYPAGAAKGLLVFIHGGYWMKFGKADWSQFAAGGLENGWAVCLPEYDLAPAVHIADITRQITAAVAKCAQLVPGPIHLCGHSAGGHLVSRLVCSDTNLPEDVLVRIEKVVSISGLHDLQPLRKTAMNTTLNIDEAEAVSESPALLEPVKQVPVTAWVGGAERPEFIRQAKLLAEAWPHAVSVEDPERHHFDVIDGLRESGSPLMTEILS